MSSKGMIYTGGIAQWYSAHPACKFRVRFQVLHVGMGVRWGEERKEREKKGGVARCVCDRITSVCKEYVE